MYDLIVRNGKLVTPDRIYEADIAIQNGVYAGFLAKEVIDAKGNYVFPGIVDCHAHLNEPGFEYHEDFETGSRAAAAAGCTCLIDMPLNNENYIGRLVGLQVCTSGSHQCQGKGIGLRTISERI